MENASKALIIAGSIIISLVIVSLGIMIYRKVSGATDVSGVNQAQVEAHNDEYETYCGEYVSAANVKALLQKVKTNNTLFTSQNGTAGEIMPVYIHYTQRTGTGEPAEAFYGPGGTAINTLIQGIRSSRHYIVSVVNEDTSDVDTIPGNTDDPSYHDNGYIKWIEITPANG